MIYRLLFPDSRIGAPHLISEDWRPMNEARVNSFRFMGIWFWQAENVCDSWTISLKKADSSLADTLHGTCCAKSQIFYLRTQGWYVSLWFGFVMSDCQCDSHLGLSLWTDHGMRGSGRRQGEGQVGTCLADGPGAPPGFISLSCVFLCLLFYVRRPSPSPFLLHLFGLRCFGEFLVDPWRDRTCAELIPPVIQINLARARRSIRFSLLRRKTRSCLQSEFSWSLD